MAISSLSAQYVSASFQNLIQISSSGQVFDGLGNTITNLTASFATTASYISPTFISASAAASGFGSGGSGTTINTSSFATTGSNTFNGLQTINGNLIITGSITANQYVISSSVINETIVFSSGSTIFGNSLDDTHIFTGSLLVTGSLFVTGSLIVSGSSTFKVIGPSEFTGSVAINGTLSAPAASITAQSVTASLFGTASYAVTSLTASYALSGGSGGTSSTVSTAQTGSVSGTTSETVIQSLTIPANTLSTDNFARISSKIFATNSSNYSLGMYINSANSLNGSEKTIAFIPVNSAVKYSVVTRTIAVANATTDTNWISDTSLVQDPAQGSNSLAHASSSIDWTTIQYALITVLPQNSGDSFICRGTYFEKI